MVVQVGDRVVIAIGLDRFHGFVLSACRNRIRVELPDRVVEVPVTAVVRTFTR